MKEVLNFKDKRVETLTLEDLALTIKETSVGREPINGISHTDLFTAIISVFDNSGLKYEMTPIYATDGGVKHFPGVTLFPDKEEEHGENSIKAHLLRRMITSFVIKDGENDIANHSLAISYHQQGIQAAFGPNIKVCSNQCILGRGMIAQTYGNGKLDSQKLLEVITGWLKDYNRHRERDMEVLNNMMNYNLHPREVLEVIGELTAMRVGKDSKKISEINEYALSQNQISNITEQYLIKYDGKIGRDDIEPITLYDFYNMGTNMYKPEHTDLPNIIGRNNLFGKYLIKKFELEPVD